MKERPILFSGPMVRAILAGQKTQTRRVPHSRAFRVESGAPMLCSCLYGAPGDRLWVRETWNLFDPDRDGISAERFGPAAPFVGSSGGESPGPIRWRACYAADGPLDHPEHGPARWKPSIHMPRWASRISMEIVSVRAERLQDITDDDIDDEGVTLESARTLGASLADDARMREWWAAGWDAINGKRAPWASNPWVWRVEFKRLAP